MRTRRRFTREFKVEAVKLVRATTPRVRSAVAHRNWRPQGGQPP